MFFLSAREDQRPPFGTTWPALTEFVLADGQEREIRIALETAPLTLLLRTATGQPASGIVLMLRQSKLGWSYRTSATDGQGRMVLADAPVGTFSVATVPSEGNEPVLLGKVHVPSGGTVAEFSLPKSS